MRNKKRANLPYSILILLFGFLILLGVGGMILDRYSLQIHLNGWDVQGTVVGYDVYNRYAGANSYSCKLYCEYKDESTEHIYHTDTIFARGYDAEEWSEKQIGKKIELVFDGDRCMAKRDMAFDLFRWIMLPGGTFIIVGIIGIVVICVKKFYFDKRKQKVIILEDNGEENGQGKVDNGFDIDGVYCESMVSFMASLNFKNVKQQREICGMQASEAEELAAQKGSVKRKDLYWQGRSFRKNSRYYNKLLEKANVEQLKYRTSKF